MKINGTEDIVDVGSRNVKLSKQFHFSPMRASTPNLRVTVTKSWNLRVLRGV